MTRSRPFVFIAALCTSAPLCAQTQAQGDVIVTANRAEMPVERVGLSVSVIGADDLARLQVPGVTEALRSVPGVAATRSGGIGTISSVFVRGASSGHTVALIDGVKINDPASTEGGFDFGRLMTGAVERIEIVRGPQSVLWGSQAIGGVVNIITRKASADTPQGTLQAEYGYRDTVDLVANGGVRSGALSLSGGALYFRTDGISAFSDARGGTERDGAEQYGGNLNLSVAMTDALSADLRGWYSHSEADLDGGFPFGDNASYNRTREAIGYAGLNWNGLNGRWRNRVAYAITDVRRDDFNPDATPQHQNDTLGRNERVEYQATFAIADGWLAVAGAEREWQRFTTATDFGFGAGALGGKARMTSVYGQFTATPLAGLTATVGVRHDDHSRFGGHTTFAANAAWTPDHGATVLRASYGEGFKAPSLYQLYSEYGNLSLAPETAQSWDVGVVHKALDGAAQIGVTWFRRKTRNLIDFVSCTAAGDPSPLCDYPFDGYYDNVAASVTRGIETELRLRPTDALLVDFSYSWMKPKDLTTGRDLSRRPRHKAYASIDYRWPFGLSAGASLTHVGASYDNPFSATRNADYVLTDIRASYPVTGRIDLYGRIENLFDADYETVAGYGSPGRAAYVGVRMKL